MSAASGKSSSTNETGFSCPQETPTPSRRRSTASSPTASSVPGSSAPPRHLWLGTRPRRSTTGSRDSCARRRVQRGKPRVLLVGRTRYRLPLDSSLRRKFDALREVFELRVLGSAPEGAPTSDDTFRLVPFLKPRRLDGLAFHLGLPFRVAREVRRFRPDVVLVQGAHEAAAAMAGRTLARRDVPVIVDVHGDWKTATRLYGSPARRLLSPLADQIGKRAVRRAGAVRTVSDYTTGLSRAVGVEPARTF